MGEALPRAFKQAKGEGLAGGRLIRAMSEVVNNIVEVLLDILKSPVPSGVSLSLGLFMIFLALLYWYAMFPYSTLARCGIRHPKPYPFFGNMFLFRQGSFEVQNNLIQKYGRVCGYYLGRRPVVMVADPDMLRQIMVKDFTTFPNRMTVRSAS
ncbi:hypothetical protein UPYG_G00267620 [Umbra pygmaea]|uniref:Uncharacterized protein n=1 Tax=Umbra pygmaea TaxID=75934 RepID=A0ABD0WUH6_UMBPY